jgi:hypothetical protein
LQEYLSFARIFILCKNIYPLQEYLSFARIFILCQNIYPLPEYFYFVGTIYDGKAVLKIILADI